jgi:hypothetical protein
VLIHPKAPKELLADTLLSLGRAPRPYHRVVSVDMYLVAAGSGSQASAGRVIYVTRSSLQKSAHIVSEQSITQIDVEALNGLVNVRTLTHRPGGSIRTELVEEYPCGDFIVRRGRVYHKSAVQCDVLEVELCACTRPSLAHKILSEFVASVLPAELFDAGAEPDRPAVAAGSASHLAGPVRPEASSKRLESELEYTARLFVEVAIKLAEKPVPGSARGAPVQGDAPTSVAVATS